MANQDQDQNLQEMGKLKAKKALLPRGLNMSESMIYLRKPKVAKV